MSKDTFEKITETIIDLQASRGAINWMIVGDWNADLDKHRDKYDLLAYKTGGFVYDPHTPTFRHRDPEVTKLTTTDFIVSNVRSIQQQKLDWNSQIQSDHVPILATVPILYSNKKTRPVTGDQIPTFKHAMQVITDMTRGLRHREDVDIYQTGVKFTTLAGAIAARTNPPRKMRYSPLAWILRSSIMETKEQIEELLQDGETVAALKAQRTTKNDY